MASIAHRARSRRLVTETKRDRHVFQLYAPAFSNILHIDNTTVSDERVPVAVTDSALAAFAQLAAIRLGATRAVISLIDAERQHILAEATPTTSLRGGARVGLWLGRVSLPRSILVCGRVLDTASTEQAEVIINDLAEHTDYRDRPFVTDNTVRFFAGVPLISPRGTIVGALCVLDNKPRHGIPLQDLLYLHDLAATAMEQLDTYTLKDQHIRGEQITRGLVSFAEGASTLQPVGELQRGTHFPQPYQSLTAIAISQDGDDHVSSSPSETFASPSIDSPATAQDPDLLDSLDEGSSVRALQESILPANSKAMFARAANIMRASSDLDGVLILDASVAASAHEQHTADGSESSSDARSSEGEATHWLPRSTHSNSGAQPSFEGSGKKCQILGFSTRNTSSVAEHIWAVRNRSLLEADLRRLLSLYPKGNVIHFTVDGEAISSTDSDSDSSTSTVTPEGLERSASQQRRGRPQSRALKTLNAIRAVLPGVRSVAFVPFWDFERSRWFAGCLCWTTEPDRLLSPKLDLRFLQIFGHSIMNQLSRLDTIASDQVKTTFVSLISHELRSPLHGILGSIQFMQDSPLDSFQVTMLNSMAACGQTLLDTIDHILDYSKPNDTHQNTSFKKLKGTKTICLSSKPLKIFRHIDLAPRHPVVELGLAMEEVLEAIYAGLSYQAIPDCLDDDGTLSPFEVRVGNEEEFFPPTLVQRQRRFIILDVDDGDWRFCLPIGAWRRILMNIFGNALKHTESGYIKISLRANSSSGSEGLTQITVSVLDTGCGMSPAFLANKVFQPFAQENPHSPGTGLGLSIVRQIIEKIGGKVEITSNISEGTLVAIKLALPRVKTPQARLAQRVSFLATLSLLRGRKICILHQSCPESPADDPTYKARELFTNVLGKTLTDSLKMDVIHTTAWEGHNADLVICPEPSFHYLSSIRAQQNADTRAPVVIFVASDGLEAATLRSDARVLSKQSVVEIMTQPCGPYKLASIISRCLERNESPSEGGSLQFPASSLSSPQPGLQSTEIALHHAPLKTTSSVVATILPDSVISPPLSVPEEQTNTTKSPTIAPLMVSEEQTNTAESPTITPLVVSEERKDLSTETYTITPQPEESFEASYVLIADDNSINRRLLIAFLNKQKLRYHVAKNGLEALHAYEEGRLRFHAILMDISMPIMDGMTATRLIREYESKNKIKPTYIVALTGLTSASARLEAWNSGVNCFLTKPVSFRKLEQVLGDRHEDNKH